MHNKTNLIVFMLVVATAFVLLLSCGDDDCPVCPVNPSEPDYHLLYSYVEMDDSSTEYAVITYSLKSGLLVDTTYYSCYPFDAVAFSPDGKYSYYTRGPSGGCEDLVSTWVTDTRTGDTLAFDHEHGGHSIAISQDGQYLATSRTNFMAIYKVPELTQIFVEIADTHTFGDVAFHPHEKTIVISRFNQDSLFVYSYEPDSIELLPAIPYRNLSGDPLVAGAMSFVPSGDSLIVQGVRGPGVLFFQILNTTDYSIEFELRLAPWQFHTHHAWHPDGKRLFMPWNGQRAYPGMGGIDVYDLTTGIFESFVNNDDFYISSRWFEPSQIAFTPEGKQMVVLSGDQMWPWPVHVIDMETKQIVRRFQPDYNGASRAMALIPIDWEKEK